MQGRGFLILCCLVGILLCGMPLAAQDATPDPLLRGADDTYPSWSPDSKLLTFLSNRNGSFDVFTYDIAKRELQPFYASRREDEREAIWSPDGKQVAFIANRGGTQGAQILLANADGSPVKRFDLPRGFAFNPQWSSDSQSLAFLLDDGGYQLYRVARDGNAPVNLSGDELRVSAFQWLPSGQELIVYGGNSRQREPTFYRVTLAGDLAQSYSIKAVIPVEGNCCYVWWVVAPDSRQVAFTVGSKLYNLNLETGAISLLTEAGLSMTRPAWAADSGAVIFRTQRPSSPKQIPASKLGVFRIPAAGGAVEQIAPEAAGFYLSPDNRHLLTFVTPPDQPGYTGLRLINLDNREAWISEIQFRNAANGVVWSRDSQWVALGLCVDQDSDLYLLDAANKKLQNLTAVDGFRLRPENPFSICDFAG
jgi:Tol biopolymer transport system component